MSCLSCGPFRAAEMLAGLSPSLKTPSMKSPPAKRSSAFPIRRPKSPPPPPPEAHFVTPTSPPTDLITLTQLKEGNKALDTLPSFERAGLAEVASTRTTILDVPTSDEEKDAYSLARRFFDSRDFGRVMYTLRDYKSAQSRFLSLYSEYLVSEYLCIINLLCWIQVTRRPRNKLWTRFINAMVGVPYECLRSLLTSILAAKKHNPGPLNDRLVKLLDTIGQVDDPFLLFLFVYTFLISDFWENSLSDKSKGLLFHRVSRRAEALECLIRSVNLYPWNWSAWLQLSACLEDHEEVIHLKSKMLIYTHIDLVKYTGISKHFPAHVVTRIFQIRFMNELHSPGDSEPNNVDALLRLFPGSLYLTTQKALIHYHQRGSWHQGLLRVICQLVSRFWRSWESLWWNTATWSFQDWWYWRVFEYPLCNGKTDKVIEISARIPRTW